MAITSTLVASAAVSITFGFLGAAGAVAIWHDALQGPAGLAGAADQRANRGHAVPSAPPVPWETGAPVGSLDRQDKEVRLVHRPPSRGACLCWLARTWSAHQEAWMRRMSSPAWLRTRSSKGTTLSTTTCCARSRLRRGCAIRLKWRQCRLTVGEAARLINEASAKQLRRGGTGLSRRHGVAGRWVSQ